MRAPIYLFLSTIISAATHCFAAEHLFDSGERPFGTVVIHAHTIFPTDQNIRIEIPLTQLDISNPQFGLVSIRGGVNLEPANQMIDDHRIAESSVTSEDVDLICPLSNRRLPTGPEGEADAEFIYDEDGTFLWDEYIYILKVDEFVKKRPAAMVTASVVCSHHIRIADMPAWWAELMS